MPQTIRRYRWKTGDCLATYGISAKTWRDHSSTDEFAVAFKAIINDATLSNDQRADRIEKYLLTQATIAGVVDELSTRRAATNPNKWDKHLAPWFTPKCAATRRELRYAQRKYGKRSTQTHKAMDTFT
jgi:hypothetical protein